MRSVQISLALLGILIALALPLLTFAQVGEPAALQSAKFVPLANVEGSKLETLYNGSDGLASFVSNLFTVAISAGAIIAVMRLSWAGYLYMTTDSWGSKGQAKEVIGDVVIGLLLLLGIYLILWQINPDILKLRFIDTLREKAPLQQNTPTPSTQGSPVDNT